MVKKGSQKLEAKTRMELKKLGVESFPSSSRGQTVISAGNFNLLCVDIPCGVNHPAMLDKLPRNDNIGCVVHKRYASEIVCMSKRDFYRIAEALQNTDVKLKNRLI